MKTFEAIISFGIFAFLVLNGLLICEVAADLSEDNVENIENVENVENVENDETTFDENSTQKFSNESNESNETVYQCIGPSKEAVKIYGILAWWMDGVVQVKY
jgi:hypothetical protein